MSELNTQPPPLQQNEPVPARRLVKKSGGLVKKVGTMGKVGIIGALILILLIPLNMIRNVMRERQERYDSAVAEVTSTWGKQQLISGPVLVVPYRSTSGAAGTAYAHFLPDELSIEGDLESSELKRGIYKAVVFGGVIDITGNFAKPDLSEFKVAPTNVMWEEAFLTVAVSDLRGTREEITISLGGKKLKAEPGCRLSGAGMGVTAELEGVDLQAETVPFALRLSLNGSGGMRFAPLGKQTRVHLKSDWPDPSFQGGILPTSRTVTDTGFDAVWEMSYYGRSYPQQWTTQSGVSGISYANMRESLFGVDLIDVVDSYRLIERSTKYGLLFIVLVFTSFFLFEVMSAVKVHPFQYVLVGVALCLFYLAVLSLSEVIAFGPAYTVGAGMATLMISLYSGKILKGAKRGLKVFVGLSVVYSILYVILCQQDYSLLYGTVGLFVALAIVMYTTRNIDWYSKDKAR